MNAKFKISAVLALCALGFSTESQAAGVYLQASSGHPYPIALGTPTIQDTYWQCILLNGGGGVYYDPLKCPSSMSWIVPFQVPYSASASRSITTWIATQVSGAPYTCYSTWFYDVSGSFFQSTAGTCPLVTGQFPVGSITVPAGRALIAYVYSPMGTAKWLNVWQAIWHDAQ